MAIVVLFLVAAALGAGYAYSTHSAQEWRAAANSSADELQTVAAERDGLQTTAHELQTKADDLQVKLDGLTTDFNSVTERVRSLADEKAQVGDKAEFLTEVLIMSQDVTAKMNTCITDLQKLQTYLVDFRSYDSQSLITYAGNINDGCNQARQSSADLSKKLGG